MAVFEARGKTAAASSRCFSDDDVHCLHAALRVAALQIDYWQAKVTQAALRVKLG